MPRAGNNLSTPPTPVYAVTALPEPGECSRTDTVIDRTADRSAAKVRALTEEVSPGVVRVLGDGSHATGFVADESGLIVTHRLVVSVSNGLRVEMNDGETFQGRVAGIDNGSGLAYVELRAHRDLTPVPLGNSDAVCVGGDVIAIGFSGEESPQSLNVHHGQVTIARGGFFKTTLTLNEGTLGGPLLNASVDVIGVSGSGIVIRNGVAARVVSFGIPINIVRQHLADGIPEAAAAPTDSLALLPKTLPLPSATPPPSPTVPIPTVTPAPAPTATVVPAPQPTPTPTQTVAPRTTSLLRPTPPIRLAVRPTLTPTPAATLHPSPVPLSTAGHRNSTLGYSIRYPLGWDVDTGRNDEIVVFTSQEMDAYIEVSVEDVFSDWSLGELVDNYREGLGRLARTWELFDQVSATGEYRESTNYVELRFRRQREPGSCLEEVVTHLYRSRYFPAKLRGYAVTMSICDNSLKDYSDTRETVLSGFREFQTE